MPNELCEIYNVTLITQVRVSRLIWAIYHCSPLCCVWSSTLTLCMHGALRALKEPQVKCSITTIYVQDGQFELHLLGMDILTLSRIKRYFF